VPIYQTVTFSSQDADELGAVLTGQRPGYAYGRIDNPTTAAFGRAVAELEGAEDGLALATGMAAIHAAILSVVSTGDRIVATRAAYGTTRAQLSGLLTRLGVNSKVVVTGDKTQIDLPKREDSGLIQIDKAVQLAPSNSEIAFLQGQLETGRGRPDEAIARFRRAVDLNPTGLRVRYALAQEIESAGGQNADEQAGQLLDQLVRLSPDNVAAVLERARVADRLADLAALEGREIVA
jgi:Flp pilus assembly protein TadD